MSTSSVCMVVRERQSDKAADASNRTLRLAFELGTVTFSHLSQFWMSQNKVAGSLQQLFEILQSGQPYAVFCIKDSMLYMLESSGIRDDFTVLNEGIADVEHMPITHYLKSAAKAFES